MKERIETYKIPSRGTHHVRIMRPKLPIYKEPLLTKYDFLRIRRITGADLDRLEPGSKYVVAIGKVTTAYRYLQAYVDHSPRAPRPQFRVTEGIRASIEIRRVK